MIQKLLIANRGEIACRILRTCQKLNIRTVAIYSEADRHTPHVLLADEAYCVGPAPVAESYLNVPKILEICREQHVDAIHPGYGLLSENLEFAQACESAGIAFIGPTPGQIENFGLKHTARELAGAAHVPMLTGTGLLQSVEEAMEKAEAIGFPVILKSVAGGGGIGMRVCEEPGSLKDAFAQVEHLSKANFGQAGMYLEKFVTRARHIEVQIFGDGAGKVVTLGERDCSAQRRNQKVIEETPAPNISAELRSGLADAARRLASSIEYRSAGTVEFLVNAETEEFYFLEVNTRLQVEHGVTEEVTGVDLVEWMIQLASGKSPIVEAGDSIPTSGHSIQVRVYAEDPRKNYQPSSGVLNEVVFPEGVRCDTWIARGTEVSPYYDPLLAKIIVKGEDRTEAVAKLQKALVATSLHGIETNLEYLTAIAHDPTFGAGKMTTAFLKDFAYATTAVDVIAPGTQTSIQDYPGRLGYWDIGVSPSGPMDNLSFRLANRLVGNEEGVAALEITLNGPTLKFNQHATLALTGAPVACELDGLPMHQWQSFTVEPGSVLKIGTMAEVGARAYLAVAGGFDVPDYLGSKSTFSMGHFGGHAGRTLLAGDVLHVTSKPFFDLVVQTLPESFIPEFTNEWEIRVTYGPHGAPDFFLEEDIDTFLASSYEVHYNSARTGIRLVSPFKPKWARKDGGEAGLHPSNIHDNPYAIGAINFTGDMPIILGPDGPSLGGFVCPVGIIQADMWMIGQVRPGDTICFKCVSQKEANALEVAQDAAIQSLDSPLEIEPIEAVGPRGSCIAALLTEEENPVRVTYRPAGDKYLLIEYGPIVLDLNVRFRVYALMQWLATNPIEGLIDITPGVRSLQIHYDSRVIPLDKLVETFIAAEKTLPPVEEMVVPTRVIHLPMSWNNEKTQEAVRRYEKSVRKDAPWCPSNIEFMRRINGLDSIEDVEGIVFSASYLVLGLGDVYLGAPAAVPVDPRHRLLTTKYNPARTWTAEGTVGIGGVYMCIYGMDSPGGYQLVGQTIPIWNRYLSTGPFEADKPWLLRFFDQVRYFPVSDDELQVMRRDFHSGKYQIKIETEDFSLAEYNKMLADEAESIETFRQRQQKAFEEERQRWEESGQSVMVDTWGGPEVEESEIPEGSEAVVSHINGNVWKVLVNEGETVEADQTVLILEAMKMEISVQALCAGRVTLLMTDEGSAVRTGQQLLAISPS